MKTILGIVDQKRTPGQTTVREAFLQFYYNSVLQLYPKEFAEDIVRLQLAPYYKDSRILSKGTSFYIYNRNFISDYKRRFTILFPGSVLPLTIQPENIQGFLRSTRGKSISVIHVMDSEIPSWKSKKEFLVDLMPEYIEVLYG